MRVVVVLLLCRVSTIGGCAKGGGQAAAVFERRAASRKTKLAFLDGWVVAG